MNNEEIKALLRDLSEKAEYEGKSETVHIRLDPKTEPEDIPEESQTKEDVEQEELFDKPQEGTSRTRKGGFSLGSLLDSLKPSEKDEEGKPRKKKKSGKKKKEEQEEAVKAETASPEEEDDFVDPDAFRLPQMKEYTPTIKRRTAESAGKAATGDQTSAKAGTADEGQEHAKAGIADEGQTFSKTGSSSAFVDDLTNGEGMGSEDGNMAGGRTVSGSDDMADGLTVSDSDDMAEGRTISGSDDDLAGGRTVYGSDDDLAEGQSVSGSGDMPVGQTSPEQATGKDPFNVDQQGTSTDPFSLDFIKKVADSLPADAEPAAKPEATDEDIPSAVQSETGEQDISFTAGAEMKALNDPGEDLQESAAGSEDASENFTKPASRKRRGGFSFKLPEALKKKAKKEKTKPAETAANDDLLIREEPLSFEEEEDDTRKADRRSGAEKQKNRLETGSGSDAENPEILGATESEEEAEDIRWEKPDFDSDEADFLEDTPKKTGSGKKGSASSLKETMAKAGAFLKQKGVSAREIVMIAAGLILLILIAILLIRALGSKPVSGNVTADEGLRVSVDKEPESWTKSGEVTLSIKTKEPITDITVNGQSVEFTGSNKTQITVEADTDVLEIGVTSDMLRNATVETAYIDGEAPDLEVAVSGNTVTLTVSDDRSGVAGVYYGTIMPLSNVPLYQEYTGPFEIEPGTWYSYYAIDAAGNMTEPVVTDMSEAAEVALSASSIALFPGETKKITAFARPSGAFLNGLTISNNNEEVISLSADGTIRALEEGTATITASASGVGTATCQVTVRQDAEITITTLGDITLGYDDNFAPAGRLSTVADQNGFSYFFENVRSILSEDDLTFANLEGPLSDQGTREYKTFAFHGSPSYTEILKDGSIEAVTLANNHAGDYGEVALEDTKNNLKEAGIIYCDEEDIAITEVSGIRVALIGIYAVDQEDKSALVRTSLAKARSAEADLIVVAFHWGTELVTEADSMQLQLGHLAIDEGADLVVGHHPHVIQGIEQYNGKYIVYSLGNFCFGGNTNPAEYDTIIFQESFHVGMSGQADSTGINIIPCHISSSTATNNYQPTPASGDDANSIMQKLNALSEEFGTKF